jgi:hypothetical protein
VTRSGRVEGVVGAGGRLGWRDEGWSVVWDAKGGTRFVVLVVGGREGG